MSVTSPGAFSGSAGCACTRIFLTVAVTSDTSCFRLDVEDVVALGPEGVTLGL